MKSIYFLVILTAMAHTNLNCKVKKAFMSMPFSAILMYGVTLAKGDIFLPVFLQMS